MKLPEKAVSDLLKETVGDGAVKLVLLIKDRENVSEFKIADKLNITVNEVRSILYRLNEKNLVFSTRKKDKTKGWYIYFWTFDNKKALEMIVDLKKKRLSDLKSNLNKEGLTNFLVCPNGCMRVNADQALEMQYKCSECNSVLKEEDQEAILNKVKNEIKKLNLELDEVFKLREEVMQKHEISERKKKERKKIKVKEKKMKIRKKRVKIRKIEKPKFKPKPKIHKKEIEEEKSALKPKLETLKKPSLISRLKKKFIKH